MPWMDLFNPDKVIAALFKGFLWVFALGCAIRFLSAVLFRLSGFEIVLAFIACAIFNGIVFFIGEQRRGH